MTKENKIYKISKYMINQWANALLQLNKAASKIKIDSVLQEKLQNPDREFLMSIPIKMDNGNIETYNINKHILSIF